MNEAARSGYNANTHFDGLGLFKFGRTECSTSPNGAELASDFLSLHVDIHKFFKDKFGTDFNLQDPVAILGAHTLRKCDFDKFRFWKAMGNSDKL